MNGRITSSIAALGLVVAPTVMKFAERSTAPALAGRTAEPTTAEVEADRDTGEELDGALAPGLGPRQAPREITFNGCEPKGKDGDPALNLLKNRVDEPQQPNDASVSEILRIQATARKQPRAEWTAGPRAAIAKYEGTPIRVTGYLAGVREEGKESPNCDDEYGRQHDFHLFLVADVGDAKAISMIVEMTPRVRNSHPEWTLAALRKIQKLNLQVRVTGWLMFDQEHPSEVGKSRGTLWEVHPITGFEVRGDDEHDWTTDLSSLGDRSTTNG